MNTIKTLMDALKTGRPFTDEERDLHEKNAFISAIK